MASHSKRSSVARAPSIAATESPARVSKAPSFALGPSDAPSASFAPLATGLRLLRDVRRRRKDQEVAAELHAAESAVFQRRRLALARRARRLWHVGCIAVLAFVRLVKSVVRLTPEELERVRRAFFGSRPVKNVGDARLALARLGVHADGDDVHLLSRFGDIATFDDFVEVVRCKKRAYSRLQREQRELGAATAVVDDLLHEEAPSMAASFDPGATSQLSVLPERERHYALVVQALEDIGVSPADALPPREQFHREDLEILLEPALASSMTAERPLLGRKASGFGFDVDAAIWEAQDVGAQPGALAASSREAEVVGADPFSKFGISYDFSPGLTTTGSMRHKNGPGASVTDSIARTVRRRSLGNGALGLSAAQASASFSPLNNSRRLVTKSRDLGLTSPAARKPLNGSLMRDASSPFRRASITADPDAMSATSAHGRPQQFDADESIGLSGALSPTLVPRMCTPGRSSESPGAVTPMGSTGQNGMFNATTGDPFGELPAWMTTTAAPAPHQIEEASALVVLSAALRGEEEEPRPLRPISRAAQRDLLRRLADDERRRKERFAAQQAERASAPHEFAVPAVEVGACIGRIERMRTPPRQRSPGRSPSRAAPPRAASAGPRSGQPSTKPPFVVRPASSLGVTRRTPSRRPSASTKRSQSPDVSTLTAAPSVALVPVAEPSSQSRLQLWLRGGGYTNRVRNVPYAKRASSAHPKD